MHRKGFSLVELSVTLVIIGIIVAAVISGAHLMQAAKNNKLISELAGYKEAVENFRLKYHAWPGDVPNATAFWPNTGNGNGNERIEGDLTEKVRAWQHLSLSHMIAGNYSGVDAGTPDFEIDTNVPASIVKGAYYMLGYIQLYNATLGRTGNALQLVTTENNASPTGAAITAADARIIDKKLDDSANPASGQIYVLRAESARETANVCVTGDYTVETSVDYVTSDVETSCRLLLWLQE